MPSMRETMRSGWNSSRSSRPSPAPVKAIGTPTTDTTESAAPPRASPSSFVSTTPVTPTRRLNSPALLIASCPVMASATYRRSDGCTASLIACSSTIRSSSMCSRPAVSTITVSWPLARASASAPVARATGSIVVRRVHLDARLVADDLELLDGGGTAHVRRHHHRVAALALEPASQLARGGRLARALQAEQQHDPRLRRVLLQAALGAGKERQQLVADDLHDLLRGRQAAQHGLVHGAVADAVDEGLDDVEVDVGLEQRQTDFAQDVFDLRLGQPHLAPQGGEGVLDPGAERVEHVL